MDFDDSIMDDLEDDEELLAELQALKGGEAEDIAGKSKSADAETAKVSQLASTQPQIIQKRKPINGIPKKTSIENNHESDEEDDVDIDNEELLNELNELIGPSEVHSPPKREIDRSSAHQPKIGSSEQLQRSQNVSPKRSKNSENAEINETVILESIVPPDPKPPPIPSRHAPQIPPAIPPRTTSSASVPSKSENAKSLKNDSRLNDEPLNLENRAKNLLLHRRQLYMARSFAAKEAKDRAAAIESFHTVKLFDQALQAMTGGVQLSEDDLAQIPPSPPPYKAASLVDSSTSPASNALQSMKSEKVVGSTKTDFQKAKNEAAPISDELKLVLTRQQELKKMAISAKQRGDLDAAKEYLVLARRMDQMVEAAKCGLPIDIQQIPSASCSNINKTPATATRKTIINNDETLKKCQLLERELLKQIELCNERIKKFQSAGESKNTLLFEGLAQQSKKDLQRVQLAAMGQIELPPFKLLELSLPTIELNSSLPDDKLELKICKIEHLKLPEGWKPSDCALYVYYTFPFPHESQQTGRTSTIKGTISPEYSDIFLLNINRKTKQLLRVCKRHQLKLEIYHKGGFFRSDKLFANASVSLAELEKAASILTTVPLLEGRRKNGGTITVQIQISKPIGDFIASVTAKRKWVKLEQ